MDQDQSMTAPATPRDAKEAAYLYDLYLVPQWREAFDQLVDAEVEVPVEGEILDAGCGTGGYALELAARRGGKVEVVGLEDDAERVALARAKAEIQKITNITFQQAPLEATGLPDHKFDLVIGDASLLPPDRLAAIGAELARVARRGATVALKISSRGSFDEFFSIYWEALHTLELDQYTPQLEAQITERLTVSEAEEVLRAAGLRRVRSVTRKEQFDYADAAAFFSAPLLASHFEAWFAMLPDDQSRARVRETIGEIIERERHGMDFDISIKATLIIGTI
jgi:SAM-dependent methyltransferase